jgi:site-specific DNA recombinase
MSAAASRRLRAAVYTRYSTDNQRGMSIDDQLRNCQRRIDVEGWELVEHYSDHAMSGGSIKRDGYQRLLDAADARAFDVLVVDELSRAWRDQVESERAIRTLEFARIRIIGISDGYDSELKARKTIRLLTNFKNEMAIDEARERTHRSQTGTVIRKYSAGGLPYGYKSVPRLANDEHLGFDREPHPMHAPIVQEIFARVAAGESMMRVVSDLNDRGVPGPGAKWKRTRQPNHLWRISTVHAILSNDVYTGRYVWNRTRWEKDPNTGIRKRIERPQSEWITQDKPDWRLVDDVTWQRVQRRMASRSLLFASTVGGRPLYLLSGLLRCGVCGGAYVISAHKPVRYGCSTRHNAGASACDNRLMVARDLAEERLLEPVIYDLLSDEAIELGVAEIRRLAAADAAKPDLFTSDELRRLDEQIIELERLRDTGVLQPSIAAAALQRASAERQKVWRALNERRDRPIEGPFGAASEFREKMRNMRLTLQADDVLAARDALQELLGTVRLVPEGGILVAEVGLTQLPLVKAVGSTELVAGAGFEPATFGL